MEVELDRLHRVRLMAGAARFIEKAEQEQDRDARRLMAYVETLTGYIEQDLREMLADE